MVSGRLCHRFGAQPSPEAGRSPALQNESYRIEDVVGNRRRVRRAGRTVPPRNCRRRFARRRGDGRANREGCRVRLFPRPCRGGGCRGSLACPVCRVRRRPGGRTGNCRRHCRRRREIEGTGGRIRRRIRRQAAAD